jgi:uncharacterized protein (TIGR02271 family)
MAEDATEQRVPLVQEHARVEKRAVETGLVTINVSVDEHMECINEELLQEEVAIERVPVNREVSEVPATRREGDVLIIPVVAQRLVVEKRWVLIEELHVRKHRHLQAAEIPVTLKSTVVSVQRTASEDGNQVT